MIFFSGLQDIWGTGAGSWAMLSLLTGVMSEHMIEKSAARKAEMKEEAAERRKVRA